MAKASPGKLNIQELKELVMSWSENESSIKLNQNELVSVLLGGCSRSVIVPSWDKIWHEKAIPGPMPNKAIQKWGIILHTYQMEVVALLP